MTFCLIMWSFLKSEMLTFFNITVIFVSNNVTFIFHYYEFLVSVFENVDSLSHDYYGS